MADRCSCPPFQEEGPEDMVKLPGDQTPQPPREALQQGGGEESVAASGTSDSGGAVWFSPWPWNTGSALYPGEGTGESLGVCLTSPHVFYGSGEGL